MHAHTQPYFPELKKDPGIPNLYPFKEQLLKQIEEKKVRAEEERERGRNDNDRGSKPRGGAYKGCRMMLEREPKILRRE